MANFRDASRWPRGLLLAAALGWCADVSFAQTPPPPAPSPLPPPTPASVPDDVQPGEQIFQVLAKTSKINLMHLDTRVLELANRIRVVDGFDADKISVKGLSPYRIRVHAENTGVTTIKLTDEQDRVYTIEVFVEPDTRELQAYLQRLFPGSAIEVVGIRDGVVLRGWVTEPAQIPEIMSVAEQFYEIVHPQLTVAGPSQVQLHVKVMEVQRSKLRELGFNFLMTGQQYYLQNGIAGIAPLTSLSPAGFLPFGGPPHPVVATSALPNSEMQFAITGNSNIFQGFIHALQTESLAKILAEPILVTTSGRPATVHSGGEFPVLVPQSFGNLSIQWREFGVRLEAVPIVLGEGRLRLDLAPEVSERDFSNSVTVNGLVVPGITSRSVNTQVEMRFGETLMIGGLISSRNQGTTQKIPFLGELPWIGAAFSRKSYTVGETELVILVTPQMVSPMSPHQVPPGGPGSGTAVPVDRELYLDGNLEVPAYGPDCPGCQPTASGLVVPAGGGMPGNGRPTPVPLGEPLPPPAIPPQPIQQTSGETISERPTRAKLINPFRSASSVNGEVTPDAAQQRSSADGGPLPGRRANSTVEANKAAEIPQSVQKSPAEAPEVNKLPGMIQPKSAAKQGTAGRN